LDDVSGNVYVSVILLSHLRLDLQLCNWHLSIVDNCNLRLLPCLNLTLLIGWWWFI